MSPQATDRPAVQHAPGAESFAARLRASTRAAHVAAELAFDLDRRLTDRGAYRALLLVLQGFHLPVERALAAVGGWDALSPAVDVAVHSRGALLAQDLRRCPPSAPAQDARRRHPADLPQVDTLPRALGALYVLEGSALGGRVIARRARTALGDDLPVAFFTGAGRLAPHQTWRTLQASLDAFGAAAGAAARRQTVHAAHQTFWALTARLDASW